MEEGGGERLYSGEMGEYYWSGDGDPKVDDDGFEYETLSKEELEDARKQEEEQYAAIMKMRKEELNENRRQKENAKRDQMKMPLDPLPEIDLCEYEKLRERNINEREEAMLKSGFFTDLKSNKEEIVFTAGEAQTDENSGRRTKKKDQKNVKKKGVKKQQRVLEPSKKKESGTVCGEVISEKESKGSEEVPVYEPIHDYYLHDCLE